MRRLVAFTAILALSLTSAPLFAAGAARGARVAARQDQTGTVKATAKDSKGQTLPNYMVRIRNLANGNIVGSTTSNAAGEVTFTGLAQGNYVIEIVNAAGDIVGTSASITVAAGATVSITVTASAAAALTGAGVAGGAGAVGAAGGISTALIVTTLAVTAGVVGVVIATNSGNAGTASASR